MNQVAIVTGGTSGIGKATALALKASGCTVYEFSRRAQGVEGLHHIAADVTSEDSVRAAVAQVMAIPATNAGASCATSGKSAPPRRVAAITPSTKIVVAASIPQAARPRLPRAHRSEPTTAATSHDTAMAHTFGLATSDNAASSIALAPGIAPNANTFQPVKSSEPAHARQNAETTANAVAAKACFTFRKYPASSGATGAKPNAPARTAVMPTFAHA